MYSDCVLQYSGRQMDSKGDVMLTEPLWTQDSAVAFESARECIGELIAILVGRAASIEAAGRADAGLEAEILALAQERDRLSVHDTRRIDEIRRDYGARVRAHNLSVLHAEAA